VDHAVVEGLVGAVGARAAEGDDRTAKALQQKGERVNGDVG
jgi:hypothetical protein